VKEYVVDLLWDDESGVWGTGGEDDLPGFFLNSGSLDALIVRVCVALPEFLNDDIQRNDSQKEEISVLFRAERRERVLL
jgi:hypothetical protein